MKDFQLERSVDWRSALSGLFRANFRTYGLLLGVLLLWTALTIATRGGFIALQNLSNLIRQTAVVGILGSGMVIIIASGNIDLSVGSLLGFISGLAAVLIALRGWGTWPAIAVLLIIGTAAGFIQGTIIAFLRVPAFIVTLGGMFIFRGALFGTTKGISIAPFTKDYQYIGQGYVSVPLGIGLAAVAIAAIVFSLVARRKSRAKYKLDLEPVWLIVLKSVAAGCGVVLLIGMLNSYKGIPVPVLIMIIVVVLLAILSTRTPFGRTAYAIGGNKTAARYAGVKIEKTICVAFTINGLLAAMAGIIYSARINAGTTVAGQYMELDAIAAAVIGGASLTGGVGRVAGAVLGAVVMASIDNGISLLGLEFYWQYIIKGLIVVTAVWFDTYSKRTGAVS